jgi:hypothetical protein
MESDRRLSHNQINVIIQLIEQAQDDFDTGETTSAPEYQTLLKETSDKVRLHEMKPYEQYNSIKTRGKEL